MSVFLQGKKGILRDITQEDVPELYYHRAAYTGILDEDGTAMTRMRLILEMDGKVKGAGG